jgi:hypothetical protein
MAYMTGRTPPSDLELRENLQKRINKVHLGYAAGLHSHSKRYVINERGVEASALAALGGRRHHHTGSTPETAGEGSKLRLLFYIINPTHV